MLARQGQGNVMLPFRQNKYIGQLLFCVRGRVGAHIHVGAVQIATHLKRNHIEDRLPCI